MGSFINCVITPPPHPFFFRIFLLLILLHLHLDYFICVFERYVMQESLRRRDLGVECEILAALV